MSTPLPEIPVQSSPERRDERGIWGILLLALGGILLAGRFFDLDAYVLPVIAAILIGAGIVTRAAGFFIPGGIMAGISLGAWATMLPGLSGDVQGGAFLLSFALGWYSIIVLSMLFTKEPQYWPLIPAGIIGGVGAGVMAMGAFAVNNDAEGGLFLLFFSLGWFSITLFSLFLGKERHWWAIVPGTIMAVVGGAILLGGAALQTLEFVGNWWPLLFTIGGLYLLFKRNRA